MIYDVLTIDYPSLTVGVDRACKSKLNIVSPDVDTKSFDWSEKNQKGSIYYYSGYHSDVNSLPEWANDALLVWEAAPSVITLT